MRKCRNNNFHNKNLWLNNEINFLLMTTVAAHGGDLQEEDDLYGKIAERLAHIGDNLVLEREYGLHSRSASTSPRGKPSPTKEDMETSPEDGIHIS